MNINSNEVSNYVAMRWYIENIEGINIFVNIYMYILCIVYMPKTFSGTSYRDHNYEEKDDKRYLIISSSFTF